MSTRAIAMTIALALTGASSLWAQSLADAAKEEQARRAKIKAEAGESVVIDNEKLLEYRTIALNGEGGSSFVSDTPPVQSFGVDADEAAAYSSSDTPEELAVPDGEKTSSADEASVERGEEGGGDTTNAIMQRGSGGEQGG